MKRLLPPSLEGKPQIIQLISLLLFIIGFLSIAFTLTSVLIKIIYGVPLSDILGENASINYRGGIIALQFANQLGIFILPSLLLAYLASSKPAGFLGFDKGFPIKAMLYGMLIVLVSLPFINWMGQINSQLQLPESMAGIQEWIRAREDSASGIIDVFLKASTIGGLLVNLIIMAVIPGIGEELLFRGVIQKMLYKWSKNEHLAVWITAFIFSAIHFQFFGFLPRFLLGAVLGYLFIWSKSLWVPICGHFLNNAIAVLTAFYYARQGIEVDIEKVDMTGGHTLAVISLFFAIGLLITFRRLYLKKATE